MSWCSSLGRIWRNASRGLTPGDLARILTADYHYVDGEEQRHFRAAVRVGDRRQHVPRSRRDPHTVLRVSGTEVYVKYADRTTTWWDRQYLSESEPVEPERVRSYDRDGVPHDDVLRTKSGKVVTEADIARWAEEAAEGHPDT